MGNYVNNTEAGFQSIVNTGMYVDKTGLLEYMNGVLNTEEKLISFSRPRRFGKSYASHMLTAYYSCGADSKEIFDKLAISQTKDYEKHLNKYDVISLDISWFINISDNINDIVKSIQHDVIDELKEIYPNYVKDNTNALAVVLQKISQKTKQKFIIIIDEWDALFREAKENKEVLSEYIKFLRSLFKGLQVSQFIAGAYITGILPIKKYGTQSALTDFHEFTMLFPYPLGKYVGFTEEEVKSLCSDEQQFNDMCTWYDGYRFFDGDKENDGIRIFNPNSVTKAIRRKLLINYWTETETYESLRLYIDMDFDGLRTALVDMLAGLEYPIDTGTFQNDMTSINNKDDVLTLLVHFGYLAYDINTKKVRIPNKEIREEFLRAVKNGKRTELVKSIALSDILLQATWEKDEITVANVMDEIHSSVASPLFYNNEQALRAVVMMGYLSTVDYYLKMQEVASGKGYIDLLFLPNQGEKKPALLVELKWNKSAGKALQQIKDNNYPQILKNYKGKILLVGISYDTNSKAHSCIIEEFMSNR